MKTTTPKNSNKKSLGKRVILIMAIMSVLYPQMSIASANSAYASDYSSGYFESDSIRKADDGMVAKRRSVSSSSKIVYSVEIISLAGYLPSNAKFFKKCGWANEHVINKQYVYTVGQYKTVEEAQKKTNELRKMGYKDAFAVGFINDNRVIVDEVNSGLCNK